MATPIVPDVTPEPTLAYAFGNLAYSSMLGWYMKHFLGAQFGSVSGLAIAWFQV